MREQLRWSMGWRNKREIAGSPQDCPGKTNTGKSPSKTKAAFASVTPGKAFTGLFAGLVLLSGSSLAFMAGSGWRLGIDLQERACIGRVFLFRKEPDLKTVLIRDPGRFRDSLAALELAEDWYVFKKGAVLLKRIGGVPGDSVLFEEGKLCLKEKPAGETASGRNVAGKAPGKCQKLLSVPDKWRRVFTRGFFQGPLRSSDNPAGRNKEGIPEYRIPQERLFLFGDQADSLDSRILGPFPLSRAAHVYRAIRIL